MVLNELRVNKLNTSLLSLYRDLTIVNNNYDFKNLYTYVEDVLTPTLDKINNYFRFNNDYFFPIGTASVNFNIKVEDLNPRPIPRRLQKSFDKLSLRNINMGFTELSRDLNVSYTNYLTSITNLFNAISDMNDTDPVYSRYMSFISNSGILINNYTITGHITETEMEMVEENATESSEEVVNEVLEIITELPPPTVTEPTKPEVTSRVDVSGATDRIMELIQQGVDERNARSRAEYESKKEANDRARAKAAKDLKDAQERQATAASRVEEAKQARDNAIDLVNIMDGTKEGTATYRASDGTVTTVTRTGLGSGSTITITRTYPDGRTTEDIASTTIYELALGLGIQQGWTYAHTERDANGLTTHNSHGNTYRNSSGGLINTITGILGGNSWIVDGKEYTGSEAASLLEETRVTEGNTVIGTVQDDSRDAYNNAVEEYNQASEDTDSAQETLDTVIAETPSEPESSGYSEEDIQAAADAAHDALDSWDTTGFTQDEIDSRTDAFTDAFVETYLETGDYDAAVEAGNEAASGGGNEDNP